MAKQEKEQLTRTEFQDVVDFSNGILAAQGYYSPYMQNQLMNQLNNNPRVPTYDTIKKALIAYEKDSENLQGYVEFMQRWDMIFARVLRSYSDILSFDLQIVPKEDYTLEELNSLAYQEDKNRIYKFLDAFDYKSEFHKMCVEIMRHEVVYTWFRKQKWGNKGMKGTLQIMPQEYCMLTGYWEKGLLFDFNMNYFLNPGVDIEGFDPIFKKYYKEMFIDGNNYTDYIPTNQFNNRNGVYGLWHQTSPDTGAWAFKFDLSNFNSTPFLAPFVKNAFLDEEIAELQRDKDILSAYGILAGEIRLFDNAKSGTKANQFAISPTTLGNFMGAVKRGLDKRMQVAALPTENIHFYQYNDSNKTMYGDYLSSSAGIGSGLSRVIYSSDRMSNSEIQYAAETQYNIMKPLYYQFENFLSFYGNQLTKKYKFSFILDGCAYSFSKEKKFDKLMRLADKGIILNPTAYAFALDMRPQEFERSLKSSLATQWYSELGLFPNTNTTAYTSKGGRPMVDDTEISDSGESNRNQ